jgi:hypothetical protein
MVKLAKFSTKGDARMKMIFRKVLQHLSDPFVPMLIKSDSGQTYMRRFHLVRTRWFQIYLHQICASDAGPDFHDHPWSFVSIILAGGYSEHTPEGTFVRKTGHIIYRSAGSPHRLELSKPAWTLVITGRERREWGFLTDSGWESREEHVRSKEARSRQQA